MNESVLAHHGVKNQKWGVRNGPPYPLNRKAKASSKKKEPEEVHEDYKRAHDGKSVKSMSDAELRSRLNRLNMEKQYASLSPSRVQKGKKFVNDLNDTLDKGISAVKKASKLAKLLI